ncbi:hypothetical protein PFLUV_G00131080 [Perca fluviatilis]|uniref:Uncharacterized protein n=1 Tax=Perca fluviatilis TaxID=8168 RepID=A0A6A5E3S5_PERFL|nr:hypothetical protein PFLUV_G00131080 [Perca fluviatilis]
MFKFNKTILDGNHEAPPPSNPWPALPDWHTHPAVTVRESVGPSGLPGPQLRLASIWPDGENTSQLKNKSNNGWTEEDETDGIVSLVPLETSAIKSGVAGGRTLGFFCCIYAQTDLGDNGLFWLLRFLLWYLPFVKRQHSSFGTENLGVEQSLTGKG